MMQRFSQYLLTPAFFITCIHFAPVATAAEQRKSTSMQLPTWVESIGKPSTNQIDGVAPEEAIVPVVQPSVLNKTASDSSRKKAAAPLQTEQKQISGPTISTLSKPTLSERAAQLFDPKVLKTAWNDLLPSPKEKKNEPVSKKSTPKDEGASLGPETSVLKQDKSDESPSWQRPLAAARSLLQAPPNVNETSAIETTGSSNNKSKSVSSIPDEPLKVAPLNAPIAEAPDETPTLAIDPASFRGAYPGKTTRADIDNEWGTGVAIPRDDGTECFFWEIEPFDRVAVTFRDGVVTAIQIKLAKPVPSSELAKQLEIADLRTVAILDDSGAAIGQVFPERGVMFSLETGTTSATAVLLESLDPDSFVLRAESEMKSSAAYAVADLEYAIEIDPTHLRAHRLLLALMYDEGRFQTALQLANTAEELGPGDAWTGLKRAEVLLRLDRPKEAQSAIDELIERQDVSSLLASQAGRLRGRIELGKVAPDYEQTVDLFTEAIRKATPLAESRSENVRSVAQQVLLDAHLGTAQAIAQGTWQQKNRVIPKWISRANSIVEKIDSKDPSRDRLELDLTCGVLAVAAGSANAIEAVPWVKRLLAIREQMNDSVTDPWRRRQIDWQVGCGLNNALEAARKRGDAEDMLDNATLTVAYLERGAEHRELTAAERKDVGDLMFQIGIMFSLRKSDHATAVTWFDKTIPLWNQNEQVVRDSELGRVGESFISMAISYWQVERRDDAIDLSRTGVDFMVEAVDRQKLDEQSLSVAYGNLATMYAEQGDTDKSQAYAEMATRVESTSSLLR
jgi:tetratricopeptide (TPR) repeat protein